METLSLTIITKAHLNLLKKQLENTRDKEVIAYLCFSVFPGTASVALAGLLAAQRAVGKPITEHRVLFLGAGEVR